MFTGLIEELGEITAIEPDGDSANFTIRAPLAVSDATHGASIAVNGVCLTVIEQTADSFTAFVMGISLTTSALGTAQVGDRVNLERAAKVGDRLGGHIVQGHIDGTTTVLSRIAGDQWHTVRFALPADLAPFIAQKGSITLDGVSLTVSGLSEVTEQEPWFEVSLIPETLTATTLGLRQPGDLVNVETDILARHVARLAALAGVAGQTPEVNA